MGSEEQQAEGRIEESLKVKVKGEARVEKI
jgi:hypothetical protein